MLGPGLGREAHIQTQKRCVEKASSRLTADWLPVFLTQYGSDNRSQELQLQLQHLLLIFFWQKRAIAIYILLLFCWQPALSTICIIQCVIHCMYVQLIIVRQSANSILKKCDGDYVAVCAAINAMTLQVSR